MRRNRRNRARSPLAAAVVACALAASPAVATVVGERAFADTLTVTAVDAAGGTFSAAADGETKRFGVARDTVIWRGTLPIALSQVQRGDRVSVTVLPAASVAGGDPIARVVHVAPPEASRLRTD
jgi:hypothetical protein